MFTPEEDNLMKNLFEVIGIVDWKAIASKMPKMNQRTAKSCKERYLNYLSPSVENKAWTIEDDNLLLELIEKHGKKWSFISEIMIGKSPNSIKNRWCRNLIKKAETNFVKKISSDIVYRTALLVFPKNIEVHKEIPIIIEEKSANKFENLFESDFDFDEFYFHVNEND
jgi:hypothetical protein